MKLNLKNFKDQFPNEKACIDWMVQQRWNGEPICFKCGNIGAYFLSTRNLFKCKACNKQFSVKVGTIFEDSAISLYTWFLAIYLLTSLKKGISSIQIAEFCGVTQKTAWFMLHRIRYAVKEQGFQLQGVLGIDESYIGGSHKGKRGRGASGKTPVAGMVERGGNAKMEVVENVKRATLFPLIQKNVAQGSTIMTDELPSYNKLETIGYNHETVNHASGEFVKGTTTTNEVENMWKHFKASLSAIYISVSKKHLQKYCDMHVYNFNNRQKDDSEKFVNWFTQCEKRITYKKLIA